MPSDDPPAADGSFLSSEKSYLPVELHGIDPDRGRFRTGDREELTQEACQSAHDKAETWRSSDDCVRLMQVRNSVQVDENFPGATLNSRESQSSIDAAEKQLEPASATATGSGERHVKSYILKRHVEEFHPAEKKGMEELCQGVDVKAFQDPDDQIRQRGVEKEEILQFVGGEERSGDASESLERTGQSPTGLKEESAPESFSSLEEAFLASLHVISDLREAVQLLLSVRLTHASGTAPENTLGEHQAKQATERAAQIAARTATFSCLPHAYEALLSGARDANIGEHAFESDPVCSSNQTHMTEMQGADSSAEERDSVKHGLDATASLCELASARSTYLPQTLRGRVHSSGSLECCSHALNRDYELSVCKALLMLQNLDGPDERSSSGLNSSIGMAPYWSQEFSSSDSAHPNHRNQDIQAERCLNGASLRSGPRHSRPKLERRDTQRSGMEASSPAAVSPTTKKHHLSEAERVSGSNSPSVCLSHALLESAMKNRVGATYIMEMLLKVRLLRQAHLMMRADLLMMRKQQGLQQQRLSRALQEAVKRHESERDSLMSRLQKLAWLLQKK
ncbi:hypothetical protein BESB_037680 [Besnoitia besnoiti]|uniref:Uncharacterized protein n=1 Tax=Besnoitia besnoiti TaxID=94643 RepID=A0A2A9MNL9_BESBE|nr:hypothetical protein BESB_037680 [Besnoitia besnoiti]PFH37310.1 hypothetical protein BESB_037680 [Besnoitia besnoiti]